MSKAAFLFVVFVALASTSHAQQPGSDPIAESLFPPDLVMRHAPDLGLEERQRAAIKDAVQKAQSRVVDSQWDLQAESERLVRLLQAKPVDESAVLAQADKVMGLEREIKKAQLSLLVRIKNLLTPAQQDKLAVLRRKPAS